MKNLKLIGALTLIFFIGNSAQSQQNAKDGQINVFKDYYGKTIESSIRGASDALVYIDYEIEDGKVIDALTALGYTATVATSWSDFITKLGANNYGLAVAFNQNWPWDPTIKTNLLAAFNTYLASGGSIVFTDWTYDNDFGALFETQFTGNNNQTQMTLDPSILTGLTNPVTLVNPGWGVFSTGLTAIGGGVSLGTFLSGEDCIVRGNGGKTIVLGYLSDTPPAADRQQLFMNLFNEVNPPGAVPISDYAIYIGIILILAFTAIRFRRVFV